MKLTWKHAIYAVLALAIVGAIALLWFGLHHAAYSIFGLLGLGGVAASRQKQKYTNADIEQQSRAEAIDAEADKELDDIAWEEKADNSAAMAKAQQAKERREAAAAQNRATVNGQIGKAQTAAEVDGALDPLYDQLEKMLPPEDKESGFVRAGFCALLILITLIGMAIMGSPPARARPATAADKARAQKRAAILIRAKQEIQRLRDRLEFVSSHYEGQIKGLKARHATELRRQKKLRQSDQKACAVKLAALAVNTCPPTWPAGLAGAGGMLLVCGVAFGIRELTRPKP